MKDVIIATSNLGKFREIKAVLHDEFSAFYSLRDFKEQIEVTEDSLLYSENVLKKAQKIGNRFNMNTIADDSGMEVFALGGRPGVFSARYGTNDEDRVNKILYELKDVPWEKRGAVFKAYIALHMPARDRSYLFYGALRGFIGLERKGTGGFGYDPIFYVPGLDKHVAEISVEEKNILSHRGRALKALKAFLKTDFFALQKFHRSDR